MKRIILLSLCLILVLPIFAQENEIPQFAYTHHQATGNRFVEGSGTFPDVKVFDTEFVTQDGSTQPPMWLVGTSDPGALWWQASGDDGSSVLLFTNDGSNFNLMPLPPLPARPPIINSQRLIVPSFVNDESILTHPVPLDDVWLYISRHGELVLIRDEVELDRIALNIQPDARIVLSDDGRIAVYTEASDRRYVHGIMGDDLEGSALVVLRVVDDTFETVARVDLDGDAVFEGLFPMWADVDEDGMQDLITTVSDSHVGSRIRAYLFTDDGIREVDGQAIGQSHRWQHQLAWGAFGANGEMQLVDVLTPHIGGVVRFYQFTGDSLEIVATQSGYTSHSIGSRNLDMAVAGDFNGDGQPEIVLSSQSRTSIAGIQNTADGAKVIWELPLDGQLSTNLAAVQMQDGRLALAAGTKDGNLRVWVSQ